MHVSVYQKNRHEIRYEIMVDKTVSYIGLASPVTKYADLFLLDARENIKLKAYLKIYDEVKNILPKHLFGLERHSNIMQISNGQGEHVALFFGSQAEILHLKWSIVLGNGGKIEILQYAKYKAHLFLVFVEGVQIGEAHQSYITYNEKDKYELYLLDEYRIYAEILAFFFVYYDSAYNENRFNFQFRETRTLSWTLSDVTYNSQWLAIHFPQVSPPETERKRKPKKPMPLSTRLILILVPLFFAVLLIGTITLILTSSS